MFIDAILIGGLSGLSIGITIGFSLGYRCRRHKKATLSPDWKARIEAERVRHDPMMQ